MRSFVCVCVFTRQSKMVHFLSRLFKRHQQAQGTPQKLLDRLPSLKTFGDSLARVAQKERGPTSHPGAVGVNKQESKCYGSEGMGNTSTTMASLRAPSMRWALRGKVTMHGVYRKSTRMGYLYFGFDESPSSCLWQLKDGWPVFEDFNPTRLYAE